MSFAGETPLPEPFLADISLLDTPVGECHGSSWCHAFPTMSMADNSSPDYKSLFLQAEDRRKQVEDEGRREKERREQAEDEGRKEKERRSTDHFHRIHTPLSQITDKGAADLADIIRKDERLRRFLLGLDLVPLG
jgi:hypothetical protein